MPGAEAWREAVQRQNRRVQLRYAALAGLLRPRSLFAAYRCCDAWFTGVTMWEVMAGSAPWPGKDNRFAGRAVVNGLRQDVPQGDPVLASLVEDCWAQDPEARPQMAQVVRRLAAHIDKGQVPDGTFAQVFGK